MGADFDGKIVRMLTRQGFIDLFWEELQTARNDNPGVTREQIFNDLNAYYHKFTGMYRYVDYNCFMRILNKK